MDEFSYLLKTSLHQIFWKHVSVDQKRQDSGSRQFCAPQSTLDRCAIAMTVEHKQLP